MACPSTPLPTDPADPETLGAGRGSNSLFDQSGWAVDEPGDPSCEIVGSFDAARAAAMSVAIVVEAPVSDIGLALRIRSAVQKLSLLFELLPLPTAAPAASTTPEVKLKPSIASIVPRHMLFNLA
ncbi:MAG: hypothetical protein U1E14_11290 [Geminicoccaceae bacterium]